MNGFGRLASLCDPRLSAFVLAPAGPERDACLEAVVTGTVQPLVRHVIARRRAVMAILGDGAEDDVAATVILRLLRRLQAMLVFEEDAITQLGDYVATLTYNTIYDFLRSRFPRRTRLRNRLRYVLQHDSQFSTWTVGEELVCGLRSWGEAAAYDDGAAIATHGLPAGAYDRARLAEALKTVLTAAGRPVAFETLQRTMADLWNVNDHESADALPFLRDPNRSQHDQLESRDSLASVWREVIALPEPQRTAILLNLRDPGGNNAAAGFILLGVATFDELASVAGLTPERLEAIWKDLPLGDLEIAAMLSISRQQVINLRQAGRRRLGRRLAEQQKRPGQKSGK